MSVHFLIFSHFCTSKYVKIPKCFSIETRIFQVHQLCITQFVDWKVLNRTIIGKRRVLVFYIRVLGVSAFLADGQILPIQKMCKKSTFNDLQVHLDWRFQCYWYLDCLARSKEYANFLVQKSIDSESGSMQTCIKCNIVHQKF